MDIEQKLNELINDPETVKTILQLTQKQTPQQKYITSAKGKEARKKANSKYSNKGVDDLAMRKYFATVYDSCEDKTEYYSLSELLTRYNEWKQKEVGSLKMLQVKNQCTLLGLPTAPSYLQDGKRIHRKVYVCNGLQISKLM
jgi:hypothetical protein